MKNFLLVILISSALSEVTYSQVNLTLKIHQPPELIINAGEDTTLNIGDSHILGSNPTAKGGLGYYDYYWIPMAFLDNPFGANPNIIDIVQPTTYILKVEDENCSKFDTVTVNLSDYNSIDKSYKRNDIKVFPVPAFEELNIDFGENEYSSYFIEIIDVNGKIIHHSKTDKKLTKLKIGNYADGYYILKIKNKEIEKTITFIKN